MNRHTLTRPGGVIIGQRYAHRGEAEIARWIQEAVTMDCDLPRGTRVVLSECDTFVHPEGDTTTVLALYRVDPIGAGHPIRRAA